MTPSYLLATSLIYFDRISSKLRLEWLAHEPWLESLVLMGALLAIALGAWLLAGKVVLRGLRSLTRRSRTWWDELLISPKMAARISALAPLLLMHLGLGLIPHLSAATADFLQRMVTAGMVLAGALAGGALLASLNDIYSRLTVAATHPIKGYVQIAKLLLYLVGAVLIISLLINQSPWLFVSGMGAMMAVILLIFRDTLLSLVAGMQLTGHDLIRVGDWVEMPQFGADGDVIDISLNHVKVSNWDKTFTSIPTHKFLDNSFRNWRGMQEAGGRRIARAFNVDMGSIRFLTDAEIERFSRFELLKDYMAGKVAELAEHNARCPGDADCIANQRRLTNIGTLRAYIVAYLRANSRIHKEMTFLVRQLPPSPQGLPIQVYVFVADTVWANYEAVQADIFDHILAIVPEFGLRVYQQPSGGDLHTLGQALLPGRTTAAAGSQN
jgi:miniconductance mechanosensitive channel